MIRGRRRPIESIRIVPEGATLVIQAGNVSAGELDAIGGAMSSDRTVVFLIHGKAVEERGE